MATEVDIANLALSHLGDLATVATLSPPEGNPQAEHAARFLPIARDTLLEMHSWKFATTRAMGALRGDITYGPWTFVYVEPNNCLRLLSVLPLGYTRDDVDTDEFTCEADPVTGAGLVLSNTASATLRYTMRVTNPARFTPMFVESLSWLLASYLAGPLLKGDVGAAEAQRCYNVFLNMFARAAGSSANQGKQRPLHNVDWMTARA